MPIRLTSPPRRPNPNDYSKLPAQGVARRHDCSIRSPAGQLLVCTAVALVFSILYCRHALWSDPQSAFFDSQSAYELKYTDYRLHEAKSFISSANASTNASTNLTRLSSNQPVICAAMVTVRRRQVQYLTDTLGSMLVGLTPEERSAIDTRLLFADIDPHVHPNYDEPWLGVLDRWGTYNVSDEEMDVLRDYKAQGKIRAKGIFDYTYILEQCYNETSAPYIALFEDDIVFADGWLAKTLDALATLRQRTDPWLYLRLFFTESQLGWDKGVDTWYTNPIFKYVMSMFACFVLAVATKLHCWLRTREVNHATCSTLAILLCITIPAFLTLLFMVGPYAVLPHHGVMRMDTKGCCTQALVYPRAQIPALIYQLRHDYPDQTDLLIEEYANEVGLSRYALAPQVVQHIGLVSTRGMPKKFTQQTWAFHFEEQSARKLREEHARLARWSIWRAEMEGSGDAKVS